MTTDRQLLERLFAFLRDRNFIAGDEASTRDMVLRYAQPPLTLHHRVAMQLTIADYQALTALATEIDAYLKETTPAEGEILESN